MQVNVNEATALQLNWAIEVLIKKNNPDQWEYRSPFGIAWSGPDYAEDWAWGGPIIERERISVGTEGNEWSADMTAGPSGFVRGFGPTPLIAAMRCYVISKLGQTVEFPNDPY